MKMRKIPKTDIVVSELSLGTMNFGQQVSKDDAYAQLDMATQQYGINFLVSIACRSITNTYMPLTEFSQ